MLGGSQRARPLFARSVVVKDKEAAVTIRKPEQSPTPLKPDVTVDLPVLTGVSKRGGWRDSLWFQASSRGACTRPVSLALSLNRCDASSCHQV